jgi:hypothetical protein
MTAPTAVAMLTINVGTVELADGTVSPVLLMSCGVIETQVAIDINQASALGEYLTERLNSVAANCKRTNQERTNQAEKDSPNGKD